MGYTYTPAYYSTLQDSITSMCKSILPFSLKKRKLLAAEQKLSKMQSDNLKWQQTCFHQILNMMGLENEGILSAADVSAFRGRLLETLIASKGTHLEHPPILRDKLLFLQELLHAKCISAEEYHASKRPLLQRLAVQGVELEARDVILGEPKEISNEETEEWSTIDLRDDPSLIDKGNSSSKNKFKKGTSLAMKHIKDTTTSVFGKLSKHKEQKSIFDLADASAHNAAHISGNQSVYTGETKTVLMSQSPGTANNSKERNHKSGSKQWGIHGFKPWKPTTPEKSACPDFRQMDTKLSPSSGFIIDKVLGDKIKMELLRIETRLSTTNPHFHFSDDQLDAISTKLPVDKSDLIHYFPKSWCERYGDMVLDVVNKELKNHVGDNENMRNATLERRHTSSKRWTTFDEEKNCSPNLFAVPTNIGDDENMPNATLERRHTSSKRWTTFDDDENCNPNLFAVPTNIGDNENMPNATLERRHTSSKRWTTFDDDENCNPNLFAVSTNKSNQNPFYNIQL